MRAKKTLDAAKDLRDEPVYTIGVVARLLKVCPATLRIWERKKLIAPRRLGKNRFYSEADLERLKIIKRLIQDRKLNIEGVRAVINVKSCWDIRRCSPEARARCIVHQNAAQLLLGLDSAPVRKAVKGVLPPCA
ncbi:MAG TPA: MerR family transcriptional regulator [Elusimicrobia bacterium]|nr:MerR family transcriptional regulator [Elusimicrobiota bacterium]